MDVARVAEKMVAHNYGYEGSGWSLSWGSSALGLTSAILVQRAGGAGDDLCEGRAAGGVVGTGYGVVDAGLADRIDDGGFSRFSGVVGEDVPEVLCDVCELSGAGW